jgi:uncharacterized LabA/DUF88 family protein
VRDEDFAEPADVGDDARMSDGSAALLIDLESFFLAREERGGDERRGEPYDFGEDLGSLLRIAGRLAGTARFAVRRAYADFQVARRREQEDRWDFYLRATTRPLMDHGIEPVQLFRYPGGSRRGAADLRLGLDAVGLLGGRAPVQHFVLVAGDTDLVPLLLELRRQGARVTVVGVAGRTRGIVQRYCDGFEVFEDLLAALDADRDEGGMAAVRTALHAVLARRRPLGAAAIRPLLGAELGRSFDPAPFECADTAEFLERYQRELGIVVRRRDQEVLIDIGEAGAAGGLRERTARHTPYEYRWLLRMRNPRVHLVPHDDWLRITELIFDRAGGDEDERTVVRHAELSEEIVERCTRAGIDTADKKVQATMFQVFKSGAFSCAEEGTAGDADFHWSKPARLAEDLRTVEDLRNRALAYVARLLLERMRAEFGTYDIDSEVFTELLEGPDPEEARIEAVEALLDEALEELQGGAVD